MRHIAQDHVDDVVEDEVDEVVATLAVGKKSVPYLVENGEPIVVLDEMNLVGTLRPTDLHLLRLQGDASTVLNVVSIPMHKHVYLSCCVIQSAVLIGQETSCLSPYSIPYVVHSRSPLSMITHSLNRLRKPEGIKLRKCKSYLTP